MATDPSKSTPESTTESIQDTTTFAGTSNDGFAGQPHAHSNPGNPSPAQPTSTGRNRFNGTSNTGHAGNPHDFSNPGNPKHSLQTRKEKEEAAKVLISQSLADLFPQEIGGKTLKILPTCMRWAVGMNDTFASY